MRELLQRNYRIIYWLAENLIWILSLRPGYQLLDFEEAPPATRGEFLGWI